MEIITLAGRYNVLNANNKRVLDHIWEMLDLVEVVCATLWSVDK